MVVVADGQLVIGTFAKDKLDTARKLLGQGIVVQEIFGPQATYIPLHAIRRVRVQLNTTTVEVRYDKGPSHANCKVCMADGKAQAEVFAVLRHYARGAETQQLPGNRLQHALGPINLAVILLLASAASYWYYEADVINRLKAVAAQQRGEGVAHRR